MICTKEFEEIYHNTKYKKIQFYAKETNDHILTVRFNETTEGNMYINSEEHENKDLQDPNQFPSEFRKYYVDPKLDLIKTGESEVIKNPFGISIHKNVNTKDKDDKTIIHKHLRRINLKSQNKTVQFESFGEGVAINSSHFILMKPFNGGTMMIAITQGLSKECISKLFEKGAVDEIKKMKQELNEGLIESGIPPEKCISDWAEVMYIEDHLKEYLQFLDGDLNKMNIKELLTSPILSDMSLENIETFRKVYLSEISGMGDTGIIHLSNDYQMYWTERLSDETVNEHKHRFQVDTLDLMLIGNMGWVAKSYQDFIGSRECWVGYY